MQKSRGDRAQALEPPSAAFLRHQQEAGLEVEQRGLKVARVQHTRVAGGGLTQYAQDLPREALARTQRCGTGLTSAPKMKL